jgi:hypothetical protein
LIERKRYEPKTKVPESFEFWDSSEEALFEAFGEGFYSDDCSPLGDVSRADALKVVRDELSVIMAIDALSDDREEFERLADLFDRHSRRPRDFDGGSEGEFLPSELERLVRDHRIDLGQLDIGVAGLVYALRAIGCIPVLSCRGHSDSNKFTDHPMIYFATTKGRVEWIMPWVVRNGCGINSEPVRTNLLIIEAGSIADTAALANDLLVAAEKDPPPQ